MEEIEEWNAKLPADKKKPLPLTRILKLGPVNLAKLTEEQIKVATDKGWSVA